MGAAGPAVGSGQGGGYGAAPPRRPPMGTGCVAAWRAADMGHRLFVGAAGLEALPDPKQAEKRPIAKQWPGNVTQSSNSHTSLLSGLLIASKVEDFLLISH